MIRGQIMANCIYKRSHDSTIILFFCKHPDLGMEADDCFECGKSSIAFFQNMTLKVMELLLYLLEHYCLKLQLLFRQSSCPEFASCEKAK